ncbi:hypothetical protein M3G50_07345 [Brachybacterium muris]|uniref:hypothetical protein n=1 Tax=Brachybacterium muris TaxID=219301 RepID=UPI0021A3F613|nr:hypothetical protein [Brachybacterium muris]MCT1430567.1 hypothetical protein [Brachybacterium muris]
MYIRVRDKSTGHEFSAPEGDPLIGKGLEVVDRKAATILPMPPKYKKTLPPAGGEKKKES